MAWSRSRDWRTVRDRAPADIREITKLGRKMDNELVRVDRNLGRLMEDTDTFRTHVVSNLRTKIDQMEGHYLNTAADVEGGLDNKQDGMLELVKKEFRIRKYILNNIHSDKLTVADLSGAKVEMYLYHIVDTLDRMVYTTLEQAVRDYEDGDFNELLLEKAYYQSGTLYMERLASGEQEGEADIQEQIEQQIEEAEEFEKQLDETDLPM